MTDDFERAIRERAQFDLVSREDWVAELDEEVVSAVEEATAGVTTGPPGERAMEFVETNRNSRQGAGSIERGPLRRFIREGDVAGVDVVTDASRRCKVFKQTTDIPFYDNPDNFSSPVAWADLCFEVDSFIRASIPDPQSRGFGQGRTEAILMGLSPSSIESIRDGLRESEPVVPLPWISVGEMGDIRGQEGRNRGVAAKLEGFDWVNARLFVGDI